MLEHPFEMTLRRPRFAKMRAAIARRDAERGRPLTDSERLANLRKALDEIAAEPFKEP